MKKYEEEFDLRKRHPNGKFHLLKNELESFIARSTFENTLDISYSNTKGQKLDIFPSKNKNSPVFVFIHGGYFKALDKRSYNYMAKPFVKNNITSVMINYDLAPKVKVSQISQQIIKAFEWIYNNIENYNGNPRKIVICGHSVGAFLCAKILEYNYSKEIKDSILAAVLLSGLYNLRKIKESYLNEDLNLTNEEVEKLSPMFNKTNNFPYTLVAVGDDETNEFIKQSKDYLSKLKKSNIKSDFMLLENKNHYTVSRMLSNTESELMQRVLNIFKKSDLS